MQPGGEDLTVFLRLRDTKIVTVVLDTQYDMHYPGIDQAQALPPVVLVQHASQRLSMAPELLWAFPERDGGLQVQLEVISLPSGLPGRFGWMVSPSSPA
jgi:hypothetical protein